MRRGPLQELPIDLFLPPNPNLPAKSRPNKRPLSPGGPNLYSPTKRRILNEEGIFSPEKSIKTPLSARGTPSSARFAQVLSSPASPARKLDFGAPKCHQESPRRPIAVPATPVRSTASNNHLARSPELRPFSSQPGEDQEMQDYFSQPSSSALPPPSSEPLDDLPLADPQSVHYPGFCVYYDPHSSLAPFEEQSEPLEDNVDAIKENIMPRRRPRKAATAPNTELKSQLLSPDAKKREVEKAGKAKSMPATPKKTIYGEKQQDPSGTPTPRRAAFALVQATTASTPKLMERERKAMRRMLEEEVDEVENDEEDSSNML
ncbi:hypothetical protein Hypma_012737 [Hypsizygus marmoreus]|uniref:Uncharacterized protein n=1 Tax=Hypsizygus marmoreus TaxID=39966 RepID=A0A369JDL0_HYPMA|nr:hypothetical protein Hypma_012737 [Hypsizygus marmoreus]